MPDPPKEKEVTETPLATAEPPKSAKPPKKNKAAEKRLKENKKLKIVHIQEEIDFLKAKLETADVSTLQNLKPTDKLKAEIKELEVKMITQRFKQIRMDDKYQMLLKAFRNGSLKLKNSRNAAMNKEELELMAQKIENKKNELLTSRNFVKEMQKVGYKNLPPKIVDNCQRSHIELDYIRSCLQKDKDEMEESMLEVETSKNGLDRVQTEYNEAKKNNLQLEKEIEEIHQETKILRKLIQSKQRESDDLVITVESLKKEIESAVVEQKRIQKLNEEEKAKYEIDLEKCKQARMERNRELEDLKNIHLQLQTEYHKVELKLTERLDLAKELNRAMEISKESKHSIKELKTELDILLKEIAELNQELLAESQLKMNYFNILEDLMGRLKILCHCHGERKDNYYQIKDDVYITVYPKGTSKTFVFDQCFESCPTNNKIFDSISNLYDMTNDGSNCYIVIMGGMHSGKGFLTIGSKENGLIWLGLEKIQNILQENRKAQLSTRMFVCSVEMKDSQIYDLLGKRINQKIEIKKDAFKMTVLSNAEYKECFSVDEVRNCLKEAVNNRISATKSFGSSDTTFVFLITFQIFNKFKHRYKKGKLTYVKLARFNSMKTLNDELTNLTVGSEMDYEKTKLTQLFQDCFGGIAKTCLIATVNVNPKYVNETVETLCLASRLKIMINAIEKNSDADQIFGLKNDIERLLRGLQQEIL